MCGRIADEGWHDIYREILMTRRLTFVPTFDSSRMSIAIPIEVMSSGGNKISRKPWLISMQRSNPLWAILSITRPEHAGRGLVYHLRGDYDRALADFTRALQLDPQNVVIYTRRSEIYRYRKDYDRALADLDEAIRIDPEFADAYAERGGIRREQGDLAQALADLNEALRLKPGRADFYETRGVTYGMLGDMSEATRDFRKTLELAPQYPHAADLRAWLARYGGNHGKN